MNVLRKTRMRILLALCTCGVALLASVGWFAYDLVGTRTIALPDTLRGQAAGAIETVEQVGNFPSFVFGLLLNRAALPAPVDVACGATLYRVQYWTRDAHDAPTLASGLLAIPKQVELRGVVSYQHGTNPDRHMTPSEPSLGEGVLGAAIFAGGGYVFLAPDYIGLGTSQVTPPYMHAASTSNAVIDFLKACRAFTTYQRKEWPRSLYLVGFSQGGHATLVAQRDLEARGDPEFAVAGSAVVAAPCDLAHISFPFALEGHSNAGAMYLGYLVNAYAHVYRQPLESVLSQDFSKRIPVLFDGEHDPDTIMNALPANPRDMFTETFLDAFDHAKPNWLVTALKENQAYDWTPAAPVRIYRGENDVDVSLDESDKLVQCFTQRGADVQLESVGPYTHDESVFHAIPTIRHWFDRLTDSRRRGSG